LFALAREKAQNSQIEEAIRIARLIPTESAAYQSARSQIEAWQQGLNSPPVNPEVPPLIDGN
jgi:hypothetical protein